MTTCQSIWVRGMRRIVALMTEQSHAESAHMGDVDMTPYGPSEPDEMEVLKEHMHYDDESGTFVMHFGDDS